eukprot:3394667-Prymnesium_polylepis.3
MRVGRRVSGCQCCGRGMRRGVLWPVLQLGHLQEGQPNTASARVVLIIVLIDASSFVPDKKLVTVQLDALWKVKVAQRKALERKVSKACAPVEEAAPPAAPPPPLFGNVTEESKDVIGLITSFKVLYLAFDSVLNFTGDAIVNATNEGCLGGGGIDGEVNYRGGSVLEEARRALPLIGSYMRCVTGDAKVTVAGGLTCSKVIHAVGPRFGMADVMHEADLQLLENAYKNSMERAREKQLKSVGFCGFTNQE